MLRPLAVVLCSLPLVAQGWVDRTGPTGPSPRHAHAMCYDPVHGYVLMYGGNTDIWTWNGTSWTSHGSQNLSPSSYSWSHNGLAMAFHPPTGVAVLVSSGWTWTWDGVTFASRIGLPALGTNVASDLAMAFDPVRNQMVLFIGGDANFTPPQPISETMLWDGFGWTRRLPAVRPSPTFYPSMCFDPVAGRLLLATSDLNRTQTFFWEWNGSYWVQRPIAAAPTCPGAMALDTAHNVAVMFDGALDAQPDHTWTFSNGQGNRLGTLLEPAHRICAAAAFDPVRNKLVLFGGTNSLAQPWNELGDTWEFELGAGAAYSLFGAGCAGSRGVPAIAAQGSSLPHIGSTFELHVGNLPLTGPAFLFFGLSNTSYGPTPLPFALNGLGAPGCSVLSSGEELVVLTNVLGTAVWQRAIPSFPGLVFYNQAFAFDPGANALGLTTSNGGQGTLGF